METTMTIEDPIVSPDYKLHVMPIWVCPNHTYFTPLDGCWSAPLGGGCADHGTKYAVRRYTIADQDNRIIYMRNGDYRVYNHYSSAYSYIRRNS